LIDALGLLIRQPLDFFDDLRCVHVSNLGDCGEKPSEKSWFKTRNGRPDQQAQPKTPPNRMEPRHPSTHWGSGNADVCCRWVQPAGASGHNRASEPRNRRSPGQRADAVGQPPGHSTAASAGGPASRQRPQAASRGPVGVHRGSLERLAGAKSRHTQRPIIHQSFRPAALPFWHPIPLAARRRPRRQPLPLAQRTGHFSSLASTLCR
jgi:hypothetical protein